MTLAPGDGLDAAARGVLMDLFRTLAKDRVVFFSSHDLKLVEGCGARTLNFADLGRSDSAPVQPFSQ
ncbi:hypothetical protein WK24_12490 [Burkholderia vietnamiensis]|nr:hypothetical protein WK24_12490 [Burkholderia vietnamiensis]